MCGFANAQGGRLLLGVSDKGHVLCLPDAAKLLEDLPNKVRDLLGMVVDVNLHDEADLRYLELVVQAYPNPISYRGHYDMRRGSTLQERQRRGAGPVFVGSPWSCLGRRAIAPVQPVRCVGPGMARLRQLAQRSGRLDHFLALHLRPALQANLIQMTVPDKPNSRMQKYRLTPAGRG